MDRAHEDVCGAATAHLLLMFANTDQATEATRDPVAPAHSFATLMAEMATVVRNTCRTPVADPDAPTFELLTTATAHQQRALELIQAIHP